MPVITSRVRPPFQYYDTVHRGSRLATHRPTVRHSPARAAAPGGAAAPPAYRTTQCQLAANHAAMMP
eukprot:641409-Hanusia_phi.AAC.2